MSRRMLIWTLVGGAVLLVVGIWVATNTYWADVTVPTPLRGEAATDPTYAAQRLVDRLGGRATRERTLALPPAGGVVMLSTWNWNLSPARRKALEAWVESGGRLVVDASVNGGDEFARWSGIHYTDLPAPVDTPADGHCYQFDEHVAGLGPVPVSRSHWICDFNAARMLTATRTVEWALDHFKARRQALRVRVGSGSVTVINAEPFRYRELFEGNHAWLLVAATQLRPSDDVRFLSEADYPPLLALTWQTGAPVVVLALTVIGLALWRNGVRSGPLAPEEPPVRRSLAEQIRGTGRFALQHDGGEPLHAAAARALDDAARRRIVGWNGLDAPGRVRALAGVTGMAAAALDAALHDSRARSKHDLQDTLARLETVRRALIREKKRTGHGLD